MSHDHEPKHPSKVEAASLKVLIANRGNPDWDRRMFGDPKVSGDVGWFGKLNLARQEQIGELLTGKTDGTIDVTKPPTQLFLYYLYSLANTPLVEALEEIYDLPEDEQRDIAAKTDFNDPLQCDAILKRFHKDGPNPLETNLDRLLATRLAKAQPTDVLLENIPDAREIMEYLIQSLFGKQTAEVDERSAARMRLQMILGRFQRIANDSGGAITFPPLLNTVLTNIKGGLAVINEVETDNFDDAIHTFLAALQRRKTATTKTIGKPPFNGDVLTYLLIEEELPDLTGKDKAEVAAAVLAQFALGVTSPDFGERESGIVRKAGARLSDLMRLSPIAESFTEEIPCLKGLNLHHEEPLEIAEHILAIPGIQPAQIATMIGYYREVKVGEKSQKPLIGKLVLGLEMSLAEKFGQAVAASGEPMTAWQRIPRALEVAIRKPLEEAKANDKTKKALQKIKPPEHGDEHQPSSFLRRVWNGVKTFTTIAELWDVTQGKVFGKSGTKEGGDKGGHH